MTDTLNLSLWVARRAEQGTLQAHADYVVREIKLLEQAVKYEADLAQQALDSRAELAAEVTYWKADSAAAWDKCEEHRLNLAKAVEALDEAVYLLAPNEKDMMRQGGVYRIVTTLAELKGERDE